MVVEVVPWEPTAALAEVALVVEAVLVMPGTYIPYFLTLGYDMNQITLQDRGGSKNQDGRKCRRTS